MHFINDSVGWISTFPSHSILHTTDSGKSWITNETPIFFDGIYFFNELKGWAGSISGEIYHTTDGGKSWNGQQSPVGFDIKEIQFYGEYFGWAIGGLGQIAHTSNGGLTFVDEVEIQLIPKYLNLYQNYPNPFNPITKIKFDIPTSSAVTLKIYDVIGKEVETLINEYKVQGIYEIEFDGSEYASGIYFYKLTSGKFTSVKKLILLK